MRIVTERIDPPVGFRRCDWRAVDDDTYDGDPRAKIGYGATEAEAIADLMEQIEERDCTCQTVPPDRWGVDPEPTIKRDPDCPVHGRDPDYALEQLSEYDR